MNDIHCQINSCSNEFFPSAPMLLPLLHGLISPFNTEYPEEDRAAGEGEK